MTDMKVVNGHVIFTPTDNAFAFVAPAHVSQPDLLTERLGDAGFWLLSRRLLSRRLLSRRLLSRRLFGLFYFLHISAISICPPVIFRSHPRHHHERQHGKKEDHRMQNQEPRFAKARYHSSQRIELGVRHNEKHKCRNSTILGLKNNIAHTILYTGNFPRSLFNSVTTAGIAFRFARAMAAGRQ